jgi:hypothetical protein
VRLETKEWITPKPALLGAVTILHNAFASVTPPVPVSTKLPAHVRPEWFIKVSRIGGGQNDPATDVARFLVDCYGRDSATCEAMCNTSRAALHNAVSTWVIPAARDGSPDEANRMFIRWCGNESGPYDLAHPDILDYERWQFSIDLWIAANVKPFAPST